MTIIALGDRAENSEFGPLTITDIVRYAGASGDFNPLHHDEKAAREAGFPGVFSMGMLPASVLGAFAAEWLGPLNIRRFTTRFKEQVWPGDVLVCSGEVVDVSPQSHGTFVAVTLTCTRKGGGIAVSGSAEFLLPAESIDEESL